MANTSLNLSSLDFDTLKENFKQFLRNQSVFKDYDFSGSNMNVLLDVMSYNSYLNSFYLNMVASEMFLDTAQKYDSVVSHAKELNYVPRSARSSTANISFTATVVNPVSSLVIPKETRFTGVNSKGSFIFTTDEDKIITSSNNVYQISELQIYEGDYYQDSYIVNYDIETQYFLMTNKNIDISTVTVNVIENNGATNTEFTRAQTLFGLDSDSNIYFIQASQNGLYEVVFGDGLFGRKPLDISTVVIRYRISDGISGDSVGDFRISNNLELSNPQLGNIVVDGFITSANSTGGAEQETIDSIRFAAPRYFATQQRAVSSDDYSSLILSNFGGEISDVIVYGGQEIEPKLYGRVIVSLKPSNATIAPDYIKNKISNYLLDYIALPNRIIISDPEYTYCYAKTDVQYDSSKTTKTVSEIKTLVLNSIINFSKVNLEKFGNDLRYSKLVSAIDNSDTSITSNQTELRIIKRINPKLNTESTFSINLGNILETTPVLTNDQHVSTHKNEFDLVLSHSTLYSSKFTYVSKNGTTYPLCYSEDDGLGIINVYTTISTDVVRIDSVGTIDYSTGEIKLNSIKLASYTSYISLYIRSKFKDIFASQNKIILIESNDLEINIIETIR